MFHHLGYMLSSIFHEITRALSELYYIFYIILETRTFLRRRHFNEKKEMLKVCRAVDGFASFTVKDAKR